MQRRRRRRGPRRRSRRRRRRHKEPPPKHPARRSAGSTAYCMDHAPYGETTHRINRTCTSTQTRNYAPQIDGARTAVDRSAPAPAPERKHGQGRSTGSALARAARQWRAARRAAPRYRARLRRGAAPVRRRHRAHKGHLARPPRPPPARAKQRRTQYAPTSTVAPRRAVCAVAPQIAAARRCMYAHT